jgi:hypothetical protein
MSPPLLPEIRCTGKFKPTMKVYSEEAVKDLSTPQVFAEIIVFLYQTRNSYLEGPIEVKGENKKEKKMVWERRKPHDAEVKKNVEAALARLDTEIQKLPDFERKVFTTIKSRVKDLNISTETMITEYYCKVVRATPTWFFLACALIFGFGSPESGLTEENKPMTQDVIVENAYAFIKKCVIQLSSEDDLDGVAQSLARDIEKMKEGI